MTKAVESFTKPDILVVDDVPENLRLLSSILQSRGYRLRRVTTGRMALSAAYAAPPDLILLDIMMPDLNGYEVCQQLKSWPMTSEIPVIFLSALDDVIDKVKGFAVGGIDYITKPFQVEEVVARIETQLTIIRQKKELLDRNFQLEVEIMARQKAEEALQTQQEFLRAVIDTNPNLIFVKDQAGRYTLVNQALANFYQLDPKYLVGKTDTDLKGEKSTLKWLLDETDEETGLIAEQVIDKQPITNYEGEVRWFQIIKKPLLSPEGKLDSLLGVATDITERLVAEQNLWLQNEQERLLNSIVKQIRQSLQLEDILNITATKVRQFLRTNRVLIYRKESIDSLQVVVESSSNYSRQMLETSLNHSLFLEMTDGGFSQCSLKVFGIEDVENYPLSLGIKSWFKSWQVKSQLAVAIIFEPAPQKDNLFSNSLINSTSVCDLVFRDFLWGILVAQQCENERIWQPWEVDFLCSLSDQLAIAIEQAELLEQLQTANFELQRLSHLDGLTSLANRRRFDELLAAEWLRKTKENTPLSLILCDVDFFKRYNDSCGHQAGDECLQKIAKAIEFAAQKPATLAARIGGEEFAVIVSAGVDESLKIAEKIQEEIRRLNIPHPDSIISPYVTISLGVATVIPNDSNNIFQLIELADQLLYKAKQQGRNRIIYSQQIE